MKTQIKTFSFDDQGVDQIKQYHLGRNWPVVYLIENKKEMYVGQTSSLYARSRSHLDNPVRRNLRNIHLISDEEFNISATLDIESLLIQYLAADGNYTLQNNSKGLVDHNYFEKEKYRAKFEVLWDELKNSSLATNGLTYLKNTNLFKYSPYKALSDDQFLIAEKIFKNLRLKDMYTHIVNGGPGTGKTILAIFLIKRILEEQQDLGIKNIALVVPMTSLRKTLRNVFSKIYGLKSNMVIGPSEVVGGNYDLLIVDEAHRLNRRVNQTNFAAYDQNNKKLNLDHNGTQLDWIIKSSNRQVLFYDQNQSIKPSDIRHDQIMALKAEQYSLKTQKRVTGGEEYLNFVENIFIPTKNSRNTRFGDQYEFKIYDDVSEMVTQIKEKDVEIGLARTVAGYAWEWVTRHGTSEYDIEIGGTKLRWNSVNHDWVNSPNAINEVGCIHTVQGYDLNYAGVIIGPEVSFDPVSQKIIINRDKYRDFNGHRGVEDPEELERYILNIYKTLLSRGIMGTYVYAVDQNLRAYLKEKLKLNKTRI